MRKNFDLKFLIEVLKSCMESGFYGEVYLKFENGTPKVVKKTTSY